MGPGFRLLLPEARCCFGGEGLDSKQCDEFGLFRSEPYLFSTSALNFTLYLM